MPPKTKLLWDHKHFAFVSTRLARSRRLQALRDLISQDVMGFPAIPEGPIKLDGLPHVEPSTFLTSMLAQ
jgi:hypothetical protein